MQKACCFLQNTTWLSAELPLENSTFFSSCFSQDQMMMMMFLSWRIKRQNYIGLTLESLASRGQAETAEILEDRSKRTKNNIMWTSWQDRSHSAALSLSVFFLVERCCFSDKRSCLLIKQNFFFFLFDNSLVHFSKNCTSIAMSYPIQVYVFHNSAKIFRLPRLQGLFSANLWFQ